jgi:hypothetical protein
MKTILVRYKVKKAHLDDNVRLIRAVFAELERQKPAGVRYASFRLEDGVSFMHVATVSGPNPLTALAVFKEFYVGDLG